jgi:hypothetical protein
MSKSPFLFDIPIKPILVQLVKIAIPPNIFQQHLSKTFFQPKVGEVEIDETPAQIKVQKLRIARWIVTKEEQLTKINLENP